MLTVDKILITLFGIVGIIFTYWFFLMRKQEAVEAGEEIDITVEGGYTPEIISIPKGRVTKLHFLRKDPSSCLEEVVLPDFRVRKTLPLNEKVTIELMPKQGGQFVYSCGMDMYHGKIIVR